MKTQRIIIPEIVCTMPKYENIKKEKRVQIHSSFNSKAKAMLTAAMLALAANAMADISISSNDIKNEIETTKQSENSKKFLGAIGIILAVGGACALESYSMNHDGGPDD